jgi:hypothetical protein
MIKRLKNIKTKAILLIIATVIMPLKVLSIDDTYQDYALDTITGKNTMNYHVTTIYSDGTEEDITSLSDLSYSTLGLCTASNGTITDVNYGKVNIGFTYNGEIDSLALIIENVEAERTVSSIEFSPLSLDLQIGQNSSFTCAAIYKDGHQQDSTSYYTTSGINAGTSAKALPKDFYIHSKRKVVLSNKNR